MTQTEWGWSQASPVDVISQQIQVGVLYRDEATRAVIRAYLAEVERSGDVKLSTTAQLMRMDIDRWEMRWKMQEAQQ